MSDPFSKGANQTLSSLGLQSDRAEQAKGPSAWEQATAGLAAAVAATAEFGKDAIHQGTQDAVSQFLGLNDTSRAQQQAEAREPERQKEHDKDQGLDR